MKTNISVVPRLARRDPRLAARLLRAFVAQKKSMLVDRALYGGPSRELGLMYFRLTPLCNLRCVMCGQRGDKGVLKGAFAAAEAKKVLPLEAYKKLVDQLRRKKPVVYLWGGEPFLYPDLFPLVDYMMEAGLTVAVNTNGTQLAARAEEIVKNKWHAVFVSLDGFEETNDRIRGEGSYRRAVEGLLAVKREKERQGSRFPYMGIVTTVNNLNYHDLYRLADAAREFGLDWHIFNLGTYSNAAIVERHRAFMKERLDTDISCLEAYDTGYNEGIDGRELHGILERVHAMDAGHPIITVPALEPDKIDVYYGSLETPVRRTCSVPWSQANIDYNGNVHFCADYPDYVLGNILETPFFEIFNGEKAIRFRRELKACPDGNFPGCVRCYQNMLCGKRLRGF
ncbi:MAG: radical SAM protein [Spirochaetaceae bacterium]|nr:radical SAM protein [Spirochaetaceae bacterium]